MDKFFKITRGTKVFFVRGNYRPAQPGLTAYVAGSRWIKTTRRFSTNLYCFHGQIEEITEQEIRS